MSYRIVWSKHAQERSDLRGVPITFVTEALRKRVKPQALAVLPPGEKLYLKLGVGFKRFTVVVAADAEVGRLTVITVQEAKSKSAMRGGTQRITSGDGSASKSDARARKLKRQRKKMAKRNKRKDNEAS